MSSPASKALKSALFKAVYGFIFDVLRLLPFSPTDKQTLIATHLEPLEEAHKVYLASYEAQPDLPEVGAQSDEVPNG